MQQYWPSDRGSILITSYNEHVGAGYKPRKLEVHPLSNSDSRELFVALLDQKPDVDDEEAIQYLLSEMMGYTLGLAQLAGLMNEQHQSLKEFRAEYAEYPEQLNESAVELPAGYKHCIASVWTMSFNIVESNPMQYQLLGMLSFIYPDEIPISVFTPIRDTASDLPPELASFGTASRIK